MSQSAQTFVKRKSHSKLIQNKRLLTLPEHRHTIYIVFVYLYFSHRLHLLNYLPGLTEYRAAAIDDFSN